MNDHDSTSRHVRRVSRRGFLGEAGLVGTGLATGGILTACDTTTRPSAGQPDAASSIASQVVSFYGDRQAGIVTTQQERLVFAAFDVVTSNRSALASTLQAWTLAAAAMTQGQLIPGVTNTAAPMQDTGEALGLTPGNLTLTIGFGPSLFDSRFGLAARKPSVFGALPALPLEELDPAFTGGDISMQACSDDPQIAFHAVRDLARMASGVMALRWLEFGFGKTSRTSAGQTTPRNLMGFKDGTRNIASTQTDLLDRYVWVGSESDQPWMRGGTYQVARRMRMFLETWDADSLGDQERVFGRYKLSGAPLTGRRENDAPNFGAVRGEEPEPVIPATAHIRVVAPEQNGGIHILRRGYSFSDGVDASTGTIFAGLFFIAYMQNPSQFVTLARKMANDSMGEYVRVVGSGLFAVPPGIRPGHWWGAGLLS
ncbi:MAG: iron uptake transporter deferrochelatase/peroxidase subunit [Candidatus Dormibacteria bacterium]